METKKYSAIQDQNLIVMGELPVVLKEIKLFLDQGGCEPVLIFDHTDGRQWDFNFQGTLEEVLSRAIVPEDDNCNKPGPGRPRLGIVSREVTLLPRHWDWLEQQPGKASGTLRRLVEDAMKHPSDDFIIRQKQEALGRIISSVGGNLIGFEDFLRILHRKEWNKVEEVIKEWPLGIKKIITTILNE